MRPPLFGPVACKGCGRLVVWNGIHWRENDRRHHTHVCSQCGAYMRNAKARCARAAGHKHEHRTREAMDTARDQRRFGIAA